LKKKKKGVKVLHSNSALYYIKRVFVSLSLSRESERERERESVGRGTSKGPV